MGGKFEQEGCCAECEWAVRDGAERYPASAGCGTERSATCSTYANGICTDELEPFFGLQLPSWSLIWFVGFTLVLLVLALRGKKA